MNNGDVFRGGSDMGEGVLRGGAMSGENVFDPSNKRARAAKRRRILEKFNILFAILTAAFIALWVALVCFAHSSIGWIFMGVAAVSAMVTIWSMLGIKHIPIGKTNSINDLLSGNTMLVIMNNENMIEMAKKLLRETSSGRFLVTRLGVTEEMFYEILWGQQIQMEQVFETARDVRNYTQSDQIGGADILIAMMRCAENYELALRKNNMELKDFYAVNYWFNYLNSLLRNSKKPMRTGGIARDLNFGYIPTLQKYARNVSERVGRAARSQVYYTERGEALEKMIQIFSGNARQNVALIGPEGSGRSLVVKAFAEELLDEESKIPRHLKYRQVFQLDAAALLSSAGGERGNLEALLTKIFNEAYAAQNIIIYLNDAQLFFKEGVGSIDIANFLMPVLNAGSIRIILAIEEQEFLQLSARNSGVANTFNRINILPTNEGDTMRTMEDRVPVFESRFGVVYTYQSMKEAYRLGDRYVTDRSQPGRALRLLELAAEYAEGRIVTANSVRLAVEKDLGIKVRMAENQDDKERILNLEEQIHKRMVGQVEAVKTVSSALKRAAAGVRNQNRPIGTFLFLGPTGVGKTELAKAVSEAYFHGEGQIVRLDLNEFVNAADVSRLIADGAEDEMSLTAQVMKRPFSIVLLDEIEKAHPQVLTALLQVLDEGVLRDIKNREVSFRDTIIIATSNAGANLIRDYVAAGVPLMQAKGEVMNQLIRSGEFKPEFLNRFDEVCMFTPLSKEDLVKIADLMIEATNKQLAGQKIRVHLDDAAKALLVERGYDPQLGARPMRRVIQKTVENLVAKAILSGATGTGEDLYVGVEELRTELE